MAAGRPAPQSLCRESTAGWQGDTGPGALRRGSRDPDKLQVGALRQWVMLTICLTLGNFHCPMRLWCR